MDEDKIIEMMKTAALKFFNIFLEEGEPEITDTTLEWKTKFSNYESDVYMAHFSIKECVDKVSVFYIVKDNEIKVIPFPANDLKFVKFRWMDAAKAAAIEEAMVEMKEDARRKYGYKGN